MTTDAKIAKQVIEDELEFQINTAKAELEVMASRAEGTMVKAEVEAYEILSPKLQAIQQKMQELKLSDLLCFAARIPRERNPVSHWVVCRIPNDANAGAVRDSHGEEFAAEPPERSFDRDLSCGRSYWHLFTV